MFLAFNLMLVYNITVNLGGYVMLHNPYYNKLLTLIEREGNQDSSEVKKLINVDKFRFEFNKKSPECKDFEYIPLLHMAAAYNSQEVVKALVKNGADPDVLDIDRWTPLQVAVLNDSQEIVRTLSKHSADINKKNNQRNTALHLAAIDQNLDMVQILLDNGADPKVSNLKGNTPLHIAANHSPDVKAYTKGIGKSNLLVATVTKQQMSDYSNEETREITQAIPLNVKNLTKMQLSGSFKGHSHNVKNARIIENLLVHDTNKEPTKALINQFNYDGYYPLHLAALNNNLDAVEMLLSDSRININLVDRREQKTALMLAVRNNNYEVVELLLDQQGIDYFDWCIAFDLALQSKKCSDEIAVALYRHIVGREGSDSEDCIDLIQTPQVDNKLYRIKHKYGINLRSMIEFTYPSSSESESEEYESDISEEQEISENQD